MEVNEAQLEARIQLPITSKPIDKLMNFNQKSELHPNNLFDIKLCEAVNYDRNESRISYLKSDRALSELSEYVYSAENCNYDSKMKDDHRFPFDESHQNFQNNEEHSVKVQSNCEDKETQYSCNENNHIQMVDASIQYDLSVKDKEHEVIKIGKLGESISDTLNLSAISIESQQVLTKGKEKQLNLLLCKEHENKTKSNECELNDMLKDILKNNIQNTNELRKRVKYLELELSKSSLTIKNLKNNFESTKFNNVISKSSFLAPDTNSRKRNCCSNERAVCYIREPKEPENIYNLKGVEIETHFNSTKMIKALNDPFDESKCKERSVEMILQKELNKLKSEYEEDLEFQRNELEAIYQARIEEATSNLQEESKSCANSSLKLKDKDREDEDIKMCSKANLILDKQNTNTIIDENDCK